ncbi:MAG: TIGR00645 family protein [Gammaproteobacteria bacterium]|jgi:uncharacterized protein (TIGR00645 family)|nr:TIGR00645 family protein [Gammaproteobacteria bacterium]
MSAFERMLERLLFGSRWLLAPFYVGLVLAIGLLLIKFVRELFALIPLALHGGTGQTIVGILSLVDLALVANLLLIIIFAGYENFVSKIHTGDSEDRPEWMGHVDFSDLKIKLIGSIVAISGIELLKAFVNMQNMDESQLKWKVIIHMTFVVSGLLFAIMDWLGSRKKAKRAEAVIE